MYLLILIIVLAFSCAPIEFQIEGRVQETAYSSDSALYGDWVSDTSYRYNLDSTIDMKYWTQLHVTNDTFIVSKYYEGPEHPLKIWEQTTTIWWYNDDSYIHLWNLYHTQIDDYLNDGIVIEYQFTDTLYIYQPTKGTYEYQWTRFTRGELK